MLFDYKNIKKLNHTEANIYHYIVTNMEQVLEMNIRELADATYVSTATIVRFCHSMHCDGYIDFLKQLREYYEGQSQLNQGPSSDSILTQLYSFNAPSYQKKMEEFAQYFLKTDTILFMGIGNSGAIAQYAARYFSNIGFFALAINDPFYPPLISKDKKVLLVVFSATGETVEVVDQLKQYLLNDCITLISICNHADCTIGEMSDYVLTYSQEEILSPQTYNLTSQVPVVYLVEQIAWILQKQENRMAKVPPTVQHQSK